MITRTLGSATCHACVAILFTTAATTGYAQAQSTPANQLSGSSAGAIQVPIPKAAPEVRGPAPGNAMTPAYVELVGRMAYVWGYPMVNAHNRRAAFAQA